MEGPNLSLTPAEQAALETGMARLERLLDASAKCVRAWADKPAPDSRMHRSKDAGFREAYDMAELLIHSAEDHLRAILQLRKTGALPQFALYTLLRAAAEAIVRCRYLLEPRLSETARFARCLNERLDNLIEQRKVAGESMETEYRDRVAVLQAKAQLHGIELIFEKAKKGQPPRLTGFGSPRLWLVDMFREYLPEGVTIFRFLSGFTHSRPWVQLRRDYASPSDEAGVSMVSLELDVVRFSNVLVTLLDQHDANVGFLVLAAGFPLEAWHAMKQAPMSA